MFGKNCCGFPPRWWLENNCLDLYQCSASFKFIGSLCLKKPKICLENLDSWLGMTELCEGHKVKCKVKRNSSFSELTDMLPQGNIFCLLFAKSRGGRMAAPLWTSFVLVETSRLHLTWSTDERNLTDILVIKTNLSHFCLKCDPYLFH